MKGEKYEFLQFETCSFAFFANSANPDAKSNYQAIV